MKLSKWRLWARKIAHDAVRNNTSLEGLHSGITPSSKTGDYSDVKVVTPYGEIEWNKLSRISDVEMRKLMLEIEENLRLCFWYHFQFKKREEKIMLEGIKKYLFGEHGISWDIPSKKYQEILNWKT
jgi:hypothetical protein